MKKKNIRGDILFEIIVTLLLIGLVKNTIDNENHQILFTNNLRILGIILAIAIVMFLLFFAVGKAFSFLGETSFFRWPWIILNLGIYLLVGYYLTGYLLEKQTSHIINLFSISSALILSVLLWSFLYFSKPMSSGGGWISLPNLEWIIYLGIYPYSYHLLDYVDRKRARLLFVCVPILPTLLIWVGMELK